MATNILLLSFNPVTTAIRSSKEKLWLQVFTEVQNQLVYTATLLILVELILNGLFFKNRQLRQPHQQVVLGILLPM